jgi:hypothetical protein
MTTTIKILDKSKYPSVPSIGTVQNKLLALDKTLMLQAKAFMLIIEKKV